MEGGGSLRWQGDVVEWMGGALCVACVSICVCVVFFLLHSESRRRNGGKKRSETNKKKPCQFLSHPSPTAKSPEGIRVCVCVSERERRVEKWRAQQRPWRLRERKVGQFVRLLFHPVLCPSSRPEPLFLGFSPAASSLAGSTFTFHHCPPSSSAPPLSWREVDWTS